MTEKSIEKINEELLKCMSEIKQVTKDILEAQNRVLNKQDRLASLNKLYNELKTELHDSLTKFQNETGVKEFHG